MGNRATPPRSFNTVKHSNRKERQQRRERGRMTLLSICVVILSILLTTAVLIFCSLADAFNDKSDKDDNGKDFETTDTAPIAGDITYTQITQANSKIHEGELIVVNKEQAYVFPSSPTAGFTNVYDNRSKVDGSNPYQIAFNTYKLQQKAFKSFDEMLVKFFKLSGDQSVIITSAYRSYDDQAALGSSISPGYSDHHTGYTLALQKFSSSGNRERLESDHWIYQNCHRHGFIVRYPDTKTDTTGVSDYNYAFRYVGAAHATYISDNNLCLEEYIDLLKQDYSGNKHLKIAGADGNSYEVYYVAAGNGDLTTLNVPSNYHYDISGDNIGGFIITINLNAPKV